MKEAVEAPRAAEERAAGWMESASGQHLLCFIGSNTPVLGLFHSWPFSVTDVLL